jgi:hypothetical protein
MMMKRTWFVSAKFGLGNGLDSGFPASTDLGPGVLSTEGRRMPESSGS